MRHFLRWYVLLILSCVLVRNLRSFVLAQETRDKQSLQGELVENKQERDATLSERLKIEDHLRKIEAFRSGLILPKDQAAAEKADHALTRDRDALQKSEKKLQLLDATIPTIKLRILVLTDQEAIRHLGFEKKEQDFDAWEQLNDAAKTEYEKQAVDGLREIAGEIAEEKLKRGIESIGSFNPPKANSLITKLKAAGITDPYFSKALRALATTPDKPEKARKITELIEHVKQAKDVWDLKGDANNGLENAKWQAGVMLLDWLVPDSKLKMLAKISLEELRVLFYQANVGIVHEVSRRQINNLTTLTEQQLKELNSLSALLKEHVEQLNNAKLELARLSESN